MAIAFEKLRASVTFKFLFVGFLILILLIPMKMVESVIAERSYLYRQAHTEIAGAWGGSQLLLGPVFTLPYSGHSTQTGWAYGTRYRHLSPEEMSIAASFDTQIRYRGIYKVPVYTAVISIKGHFLPPGKGEDGDAIEGYLVNEAVIQIPIKNIRAIKQPPELSWNGMPLKLTPRRAETADDMVIYYAKLPKLAQDDIGAHDFEINLELAGSGGVAFIPWAKRSKIKIDSDWGSPSFNGVYLPTSHEITDDSFSAHWNTGNLLTDAGETSKEYLSGEWFKEKPEFGVKFIQPADTYQLSTRAAKYAVLFIGLTFLVYFFIEVSAKVVLHPIQYLLVGFANCIFYLLLLSLAEHINFNLAYFISTCASTLLISLYSISVLGSKFKALFLFIVLAALFSYLFVTLQSEGFALVIGAIGLFTILACIMYFTRHLNWYVTAKDVKPV